MRQPSRHPTPRYGPKGSTRLDRRCSRNKSSGILRACDAPDRHAVEPELTRDGADHQPLGDQPVNASRLRRHMATPTWWTSAYAPVVTDVRVSGGWVG